MSFREIFERYKNGDITEEEKQYVEEEIEKNELINDYLAEGFEEENLSLVDNLSTEPDIKKLNRSIQKRIAKYITVVLAVLLVIVFGIKPLMDDNIYYNPISKNLSEFGLNSFFYGMDAYTELFYPEEIINYIETKKLGPAKYKIELNYQGKDRTTVAYTTVLNKGVLDRFLSSEFTSVPGNVWYDRGPTSTIMGDETKILPSGQPVEDFENNIKVLKKLPEMTDVRAYVSFEKDINMQQLEVIIKRNSDISFLWCGLAMLDGRNPYQSSVFGFQPHSGGKIYGDEKELVSYPILNLRGYDVTGPNMEQHVLSLVNYLKDNDQFVSTIWESNINFKLLSELLSEDGVYTYGGIVYGTPKKILELIEREDIATIWIDDAKLSTYLNE